MMTYPKPAEWSRSDSPESIPLTAEYLRGWPLPGPDEQADKDGRGQVLVVGGSREIPGAVVLSGMAALRSGAGRLRLATCESMAPSLALSILESRVFPLPETPAGAIAAEAAVRIVDLSTYAHAVVIGPGMLDPEAVTLIVRQFVDSRPKMSVVLDAAALSAAMDCQEAVRALEGRAILTPHADEMARMLGTTAEAVEQDRRGHVQQASEILRAVVALKGSETLIAEPGGKLFVNTTGNVGLATSGSGDTLSGIIGGFAARGASPLQAAAWGVFVHGVAGDELSRKIGPVGYLAREILDEIPGLLVRFGGR